MGKSLHKKIPESRKARRQDNGDIGIDMEDSSSSEQQQLESDHSDYESPVRRTSSSRSNRSIEHANRNSNSSNHHKHDHAHRSSSESEHDHTKRRATSSKSPKSARRALPITGTSTHSAPTTPIQAASAPISLLVTTYSFIRAVMSIFIITPIKQLISPFAHLLPQESQGWIRFLFALLIAMYCMSLWHMSTDIPNPKERDITSSSWDWGLGIQKDAKSKSQDQIIGIVGAKKKEEDTTPYIVFPNKGSSSWLDVNVSVPDLPDGPEISDWKEVRDSIEQKYKHSSFVSTFQENPFKVRAPGFLYRSLANTRALKEKMEAASYEALRIGGANSSMSNASTLDIVYREAYTKMKMTHPFSRVREDLFASTRDLEKAYTLDTVRQDYTKLVLTYTKPFVKGIPRDSLLAILRRRNYHLTPPGAMKGTTCILIQIVKNKVYILDPYEIVKNAKDFYRSRLTELVWLLTEMANEERLPDVEFLLAVHDCVQTVNEKHAYRGPTFYESAPVFTIVACNFSDNIPFPAWEGNSSRGGQYRQWDETMRNFMQDSIPWERKASQAAFRGGLRPSMYFKEKTQAERQCEVAGRSRLKFLSEGFPEMLDVSVWGTCGNRKYKLKRMSMEEHRKFKYVLYVEGNCFWADRINMFLFGPSVLIKQETPCGQFYEPLLEPHIHYVPVNYFMDDLVFAIRFLQENDEYARGIVRNMNKFAISYLSLDGIKMYVEILLKSYHSLLIDKNIEVEIGAVDVTDAEM